MGGLDDATFGCVCVGAWMQICGFLQMPFLLGPSFSPFHALMALFGKLLQQLPRAEVNLVPEGAPSAVKVESNGACSRQRCPLGTAAGKEKATVTKQEKGTMR